MQVWRVRRNRRAKEKDKHRGTEDTELHRGRNLGREKQEAKAKPKRA